MIKAVRSDQKSFKTVRFSKGLNIVLAERTKLSSDKDSRNGLGKSTLIEIIHFCLGSSATGEEGIRSKELEGWTFIIDLTLGDKDYTASRNTADSSKIWLEGDFFGWPIQPEMDSKQNKKFLKVRDWCQILGFFMFDLSREITEKSYSPTFRSLISYFARRGVEAFANPFKHYGQQQEWDKQVQNAYLLGLNWEYASEFQRLKDKEKILINLKSASEEGLLADFIGSIGTLEAEQIALGEEIREFERQTGEFKVHPQYYDIQKKADQITLEIHRLVNQRTINSAILKSYEESIKDERDVSQEEVVRIYKEAGLSFPQATEKKIQDILNFHTQVIRNRRTYLKSEIEKVSRDVEQEEMDIEKLSTQRATLLETLKTHGALDEYSKLQQQLNKLRQRRENIGTKIDNLKKFELGIEQLDTEKKELLQKTRQDKDERKEIIENAIKLFNQNSRALYDEPGVLSIDVGQSGYKFGVDIKRAKSQGIGYMKVFCYDLMLIQLRSSSFSDMPGFLVHDSTIFDGVDERQIAKALELAAQEAEKRDFQYICTVNSDMIPEKDFTKEFSKRFDSYVKLRLSDASEDGGLLGIRF